MRIEQRDSCGEQRLKKEKSAMRWGETYGNGYTSLVGAIIHQAVEDLNHEDECIKNSAIEFFYSENFNEWCSLLNVSPDYIRKIAGLDYTYIFTI